MELPRDVRMWRNWQARMVQVHVPARVLRFKSFHPHHHRFARGRAEANTPHSFRTERPALWSSSQPWRLALSPDSPAVRPSARVTVFSSLRPSLVRPCSRRSFLPAPAPQPGGTPPTVFSVLTQSVFSPLRSSGVLVSLHRL